MTIWKNSRFPRFFSSFTISNIGDWFDIFALQIIFVHQWHASPLKMSLLLLLYFLPGMLLSPFAGICADHFNKRNLMFITDIISAIFTVGLLLSTNIINALIFILFRSSIASINTPTQQAYLKYSVASEYLLQAASYTSVMQQLCKILGPMLGATILLFAPAKTCIAINAASFIVSACILMTLPKDEPITPSLDHSIKNKTSHWLGDFKMGSQFIWKHKTIRQLLFLVVIWFMCSMIRQTQLAIFLAHLLPNEPDALGFVIGLEGLGAILAGTILCRKADIKNYMQYLVLGFALLGIGIFGMAIYQGVWPKTWLFLSAFILGLGTGTNLVTYSFALKKETPDHQIVALLA